jgi:hypothetical protein
MAKQDELRRALAALNMLPGASWADVRRRYRSLARATHPDRAADACKEAAAHRFEVVVSSYRFIEDNRELLGGQPSGNTRPAPTYPRYCCRVVACCAAVALLMLPAISRSVIGGSSNVSILPATENSNVAGALLRPPAASPPLAAGPQPPPPVAAAPWRPPHAPQRFRRRPRRHKPRDAADEASSAKSDMPNVTDVAPASTSSSNTATRSDLMSALPVNQTHEEAARPALHAARAISAVAAEGHRNESDEAGGDTSSGGAHAQPVVAARPRAASRPIVHSLTWRVGVGRGPHTRLDSPARLPPAADAGVAFVEKTVGGVIKHVDYVDNTAG